MPKCSIHLHDCTSSRIHSHGYDPESKTLALRFNNKGTPGPTYQYANVTTEMYEGLMNAESIGKWFGANLQGKTEAHPFTKMDPEEQAEEQQP